MTGISVTGVPAGDGFRKGRIKKNMDTMEKSNNIERNKITAPMIAYSYLVVFLDYL